MRVLCDKREVHQVPNRKCLRGETEVMQEQMGSGEIAELVQQMEQSEDDPRRCYAIVQQRIREYRQAGHSVPDDLARIEKTLMTECMAASQGR